MGNDIEVFLSLGSNMGNRQNNLLNTIASIEKYVGRIVKKSSIYKSQAWGKTDQEDFLNQIISIYTSLDAQNILKLIQKIEFEMGRVRDLHWGPRIIDIDILFYNSQIIRQKDLIIPHKELANRKFILIPLIEVAPDFVHPILNKTIEHLLKACSDPLSVVVVKS